jgi:hypothetical protein
MRNRWNLRPDRVEPVDSKELLVFLRDWAPPILKDVGDDQHVRAVVIELEPLGDVFP